MAWDRETVAAVKRMAIDGAGEAAIAVALKLPRSELREILEVLEIDLDEEEPLKWCSYGAHWVPQLDEQTGWCPVCKKRVVSRDKRQRDLDEAAEALRKAERDDATLRKKVERLREKSGMNPRRGKEAQDQDTDAGEFDDEAADADDDAAFEKYLRSRKRPSSGNC